MYPESWSQITQTTTVFNYFLLVSWTFHQFLKFDRPRVKYMFLKDNFLVPCLSYFSFCESYYPSPNIYIYIFSKEKSSGPTSGRLCFYDGWGSYSLFVLPTVTDAFSGDTATLWSVWCVELTRLGCSPYRCMWQCAMPLQALRSFIVQWPGYWGQRKELVFLLMTPLTCQDRATHDQPCSRQSKPLLSLPENS